jgi:hypothetical protein
MREMAMSLWSPGFTLLELLAVLIAGYVIGRLHATRRNPQIRERRRQEAVRAIVSAEQRLGMLAPEVRVRVEAYLARGHVIDAVKEVRAALDCGLKEAKDVVDFLQAPRAGGARAP